MMPSDDELREIIRKGESDRVEFTRSSGKLDKCREAICAFANDLPDHRKPGFIFLGLNDDGTCSGLTIDDELMQKLGGLKSDGKIQPLPSIVVGRKILDDCEFAVIEVQPSDNPPLKMDGRCWVRVGPTRGQATAEDERRLTEKRRSKNMPYDMRGVSGASVENDLDMRKFEDEYLPVAVSPEVLEKNDRDRGDQLRALRLEAEDGTPTVTAILMLGKSPFYWFPGAYVQFVRYAGNKVTDPVQDQKEVRGSLPDQLRELDGILQANISVALDTQGERHDEQPDYPYEALRELARNAVIHRNYEGSSAPVRINWFADNVEIISSGGVHGEVTSENFGQRGVTSYRNPTIAEAMKYMGFMQRFGIGIETARRTLRQNGNPELELKVEASFVFARVRKHP